MVKAMVNPELCGIVTSTRRPLLIDTISLSCALYRALGLSGETLDVGCHVGIVPDIMSLALGVPAVGIDPEGAAIHAGTSALESQRNVRLIHAAVPWKTDLRFDLVTAIDSLPQKVGDQAVFLKGIGALLRDGGVAVVTSQHWIFADVAILRRQLALAGLGFGIADVAGGFGFMPTQFSTETTACFLKGGKRPFPRRFKEEAESEWDQFRKYANAYDTPIREKTQAFLRATTGPHCDA